MDDLCKYQNELLEKFREDLVGKTQNEVFKNSLKHLCKYFQEEFMIFAIDLQKEYGYMLFKTNKRINRRFIILCLSGILPFRNTQICVAA